MREHKLTMQEVQDLVIADVALTIAFAILFTFGGSFGVAKGSYAFVYYLPIAFVAVTFSFVLHEYMNKMVAEHFGAIAAFRRSDTGIIIALLTSMFGFLMAMPGATVIYTNTFTKKEEGYVSLAGPLTNFVIFGAVFVISLFSNTGNTYIQTAISVIMFISLWLAFVNMLPIYPLDGSKVLRWNKGVYAVVLIAVIALMVLLIPSTALIFDVVIVLILSLVMSFMSRNILFRRW